MSAHAENNCDTRVLLPFASGNVVEIELSCHEDEGADRPLKTYPLYDAGVDMVRTADCAGETACRLAREDGLAGGRYSIGYLLKELPPDASIAGESGGLAMALALYCELTSFQGGKIAATGCLAGIKGDEVLRVKGITGKLEGLLAKLSAGSKVFIPKDNEKGLEPLLTERYGEAGIALYPVATVREAVRILKGEVTVNKANPTGFRPWLLAVGFAVIAVVGFWMYFGEKGTGGAGAMGSHDEMSPVVETLPKVEDTAIAAGEPLISPAPEQVEEREVPPPTPQFSQGFE